MTVQIEKRPLDKQAADAIRHAILAGAVPLGVRLKEVELSEKYGLARSTVRTALHQLANEGLVNQIPYKGWCVFELTAQDIWELYTLRASLEALAAGLAAKKGGAQVRASLLTALDELQSACERGDAALISEADFQIHRRLVEASAHKRLQAQYKLVEQQIRVFITSSNALVSEPAAIMQQHRPIVAAVLEGAAEKATRLASEHSLTEGEKLFAHQRALESRHSQAGQAGHP